MMPSPIICVFFFFVLFWFLCSFICLKCCIERSKILKQSNSYDKTTHLTPNLKGATHTDPPILIHGLSFLLSSCALSFKYLKRKNHINIQSYLVNMYWGGYQSSVWTCKLIEAQPEYGKVAPNTVFLIHFFSMKI